MASWQEFEGEMPRFAAQVKAIFDRHRHKTMATLRRDGSPRISGTEVDFRDGDMWLGSMPGAVKALDLRRDPRVALHSGSDDPDESDPTAWPGDAKVAGRAIEVAGPGTGPGQAHEFRLDITEVVRTYVARGLDGGDPELVVEMWHEGRGHREVRRT